MSLIRFLIILSILIVTAEGAESAEPSQRDQSISKVEDAMRTMIANLPKCETTREPGGTVLRFIGKPDQRLLECVARYLSENSVTVEITSMGEGSAALAIASAQLIWLKGWKVHVVGICAGNCSNFIVPAAKTVVVSRYSVIVREGEVSSTTLQAAIERSRSRVNSQARGSPEDINRTLNRSINGLLLEVEAQRRFGVKPCYNSYPAISDSRNHEAGQRQKRLAWLADERTIRSLTSASVTGKYWQPTSLNDWQALARIYTDFDFIRRAPTCN